MTSEVEKHRLEIAELRKKSKKSTRKISPLQEKASKNAFSKGGTHKFYRNSNQRKGSLSEKTFETLAKRQENEKSKEKICTMSGSAGGGI